MATINSQRACPNKDCALHRLADRGNIHPHGWYKTKHGRRRRYICKACGMTFASTRGSAYHKLKASRQQIDQACHMSAEGVNISVISKVRGRSGNTIYRWLERARTACSRFQEKHLRGYELREPQADEIKAFVGPRNNKIGIMAIIEVSTRLWPSTHVGKRNYKNVRKLFGETFQRGISDGRVLITTDGFKPYEWVLKRMFGPACFYDQVLKTWRKSRITKVDREILIGEPWQVQHALECSEDSEDLNTSFIERLNLPIRRNTSYLHRQTPAHARSPQALAAQLDLQRYDYNFMRPHLALKSGNQIRPPAMMAGIAKRKLTWRDVLSHHSFIILLGLHISKEIQEGGAQAAA